MVKQTKTYWDIIELLPSDMNIEDEVWMPVDICLSCKVNSCHLTKNSVPEIYSHHGGIFSVWNDFLLSFCLKGPLVLHLYYLEVICGEHFSPKYLSCFTSSFFFTSVIVLTRSHLLSRHYELATVRENKDLLPVMLKCSIQQQSAITDKSIMHYIWPLFILHCLYNIKLINADLNQNARPVQAFLFLFPFICWQYKYSNLHFSRHTSNATEY